MAQLTSWETYFDSVQPSLFSNLKLVPPYLTTRSVTLPHAQQRMIPNNINYTKLTPWHKGGKKSQKLTDCASSKRCFAISYFQIKGRFSSAPSGPIIHHSSFILSIKASSHCTYKMPNMKIQPHQADFRQSPRPLTYKDPSNTIVSFLILFFICVLHSSCLLLLLSRNRVSLSFFVNHASNHIRPELSLKPISYIHLSWISLHLDSGRNYTNFSPTPGTPRFIL